MTTYSYSDNYFTPDANTLTNTYFYGSITKEDGEIVYWKMCYRDEARGATVIERWYTPIGNDW